MKDLLLNIIDKVARTFAAWEAWIDRALPKIKTKLAGASVIVLGQIAVATDVLQPGQDAAIIEWIISTLEQAETYLGLATIYFRNIGDRVRGRGVQ